MKNHEHSKNVDEKVRQQHDENRKQMKVLNKHVVEVGFVTNNSGNQDQPL
jgi:hypothetical protein